MSRPEQESPVQGRWNVLRAGHIDGDSLGIPSLPLGATTNAGPVRLAVGSGGEARLLVPLAAGEMIGTLETGSALKIGLTTLTHEVVAVLRDVARDRG